MSDDMITVTIPRPKEVFLGSAPWGAQAYANTDVVMRWNSSEDAQKARAEIQSAILGPLAFWLGAEAEAE